MVVNANKLVSQSPEDVHLTPFFWVNVPEMKFHEQLVYIVEMFSWEVFECFIFAAFAVNLQRDVFFEEIISFEDVFESREIMLCSFFSHCSCALKIEDILPIVLGTIGSLRIGAVELIVRH